MKQSPMARVGQELQAYLNEADFGWQLLVLASCLLLALFARGLLGASRTFRRGGGAQTNRGGHSTTHLNDPFRPESLDETVEKLRFNHPFFKC